MKKVLSLVLVGVFVLSIGAFAFADTFSSPAEIYANLTGKTTDEAYALRNSTSKTYGQLAEDAGLLDEFRDANLEVKKAILEDRVKNGIITQEQADEILAAIENSNCTVPGENRIGQNYGVGFGKGFNGNGIGMGRGNGMQLRDGSHAGQGFSAGRGFEAGRFSQSNN
ncbi:DUF2680 domain-containing protein [Caloranaerobacter sp. DY30410]|uniref:DUF2680 domain-containing protein n=1 Tax=Caloranaerobacter sp. DY30410 TaxID=3238305 RepID=UPI003CFFAD2B